MNQEIRDIIDDLEEVAGLLKNSFVAKDELIELMITCAIAQEHLLIVGPPGTAKSELVKRFALLCSAEGSREQNGRIPYFEYLLTRFTEPNEIFGPVNIRAFQQGGGHRRVTDGMLPQAEIAFLDEVFKANSAILNALLTVMNERIFYNGGRRESLPLICSIGATNEVPEDTTLAALYDRFLVRVWTDNVDEARFTKLLRQGWKLEIERIRMGYAIELGNITTTDDLRVLYRSLDEIDMKNVEKDYHEIVRRIRAEGIELSDRRVIKLLKLVAASALRRKSGEANTGDFWMLRHVWNKPEQIPHLSAIIEPYLKDFDQVMWNIARNPELIENDINLLIEQQKSLRTDADYADFLQQADRLRKELINHEDKDKTKPLLERLNKIIDEAMKMLEQKV